MAWKLKFLGKTKFWKYIKNNQSFWKHSFANIFFSLKQSYKVEIKQMSCSDNQNYPSPFSLYSWKCDFDSEATLDVLNRHLPIILYSNPLFFNVICGTLIDRNSQNISVKSPLKSNNHMLVLGGRGCML